MIAPACVETSALASVPELELELELLLYGDPLPEAPWAPVFAGVVAVVTVGQVDKSIV